MSNLNWCTYCDNAVEPFSESLYCSNACLRADALNHHPLLGYDYAELQNFPCGSRRHRRRSSLQPATSSPLSSPPMTPPDIRIGCHNNFSFTGNNKISPPIFTLDDPAHKPSPSTTFFI